MSLLIQYDFSASSFQGPNIIKNIAPGNMSYEYNATLVNNPIINSPGVTDDTASVLFDSTQQQYINVPPLLTLNNGLTFTFWFKSVNNSGWAERIFDFSNGAGNNNIIAFFNNGFLALSVYAGPNGNQAYQPLTVVPNINNNTWIHIGWTLSPSNVWNIYVNGVLYQTYSSASYPNSVYRNTNYLARSPWTTDPYYTGNIADFRFYNSLLQASDIQNIYNYDLSLQSSTSGDAVINSGYNQLYNQIFCDLFKTNNGFNQCQNCNYGSSQSVYSKSTQSGEQNCLNACNSEPNCTSYSYDTTSSNNNCTFYNSFPSVILNGANGLNSGYSLGKYSYDFNNLTSDQKSDVQQKCIAQYLNNKYTPNKNIDVSSCLNYNNSDSSTNINADPTCIYNTYNNNGIKIKTIDQSVYEDNPNLNITQLSDPIIDEYNKRYTSYSDNLRAVLDINSKNPPINTPNQELNIKTQNNNYLNQFKSTVTALTENFDNEMDNKNYVKLAILLIIIIIIILIFWILYRFINKNKLKIK
jgi:hypothetical protein